MRIKAEAGIAVKLLVFVGAHPNGYERPELREEIKISIRNISRVFNVLMDNGLVTITYPYVNYSSWIYQLTKPAEEINLWDVISLFDNEIYNGLCKFCRKPCDQKPNAYDCACGAEMADVINIIDKWMRSTTIQDLIEKQNTERGGLNEN